MACQVFLRVRLAQLVLERVDEGDQAAQQQLVVQAARFLRQVGDRLRGQGARDQQLSPDMPRLGKAGIAGIAKAEEDGQADATMGNGAVSRGILTPKTRPSSAGPAN
jgi:hypothetical protein